MPADFSDDPFSKRADELFRRLDLETEPLVEPLPASEIRRLGDRRRTRRRVGTAAGTLALAAVAASGAMLLPGTRSPQRAVPAAPAPTITVTVTPHRSRPSTSQRAVATPAPTTQEEAPQQSRTPGATASPTATASPSAAAASAGATPSAAATTASASPTATARLAAENVAELGNFARGGDTSMYTSQRTEPETSSPQYAVSVCEKNRAALGQQGMVHRVAEGQGIITHAIAYQFADTATASQARSTLRAWYAQCPQQMADNSVKGARMTTPVDTAVGSHAKTFPPTQATFRLVSGMSSSGEPFFEEASIYQVGSRLEWVVTTLTGVQDDSMDTAPGGPTGSLYPGIEHSAAITNRLAPQGG